jgi:hypothetical protein
MADYMTPKDQDVTQLSGHCCKCYHDELAYQREAMTEQTIVVRAIDACENTGEGSLAAQSYLAAFFKRAEANITSPSLSFPKWDTK